MTNKIAIITGGGAAGRAVTPPSISRVAAPTSSSHIARIRRILDA
jgi:hypothetical protein